MRKINTKKEIELELKIRKMMKDFLIWCRDRNFVKDNYQSTTQLSAAVADEARFTIEKIKKLQEKKFE